MGQWEESPWPDLFIAQPGVVPIEAKDSAKSRGAPRSGEAAPRFERMFADFRLDTLARRHGVHPEGAADRFATCSGARLLWLPPCARPREMLLEAMPDFTPFLPRE